MPSQACLHVENYHYHGYNIHLNIPELTLSRGQITGLMGQSGHGKTLLCHAILQFHHRCFQTGNIWFGDQNICMFNEQQLARLRNRHIRLLPNSPSQALNPLMTCYQQIKEVYTLNPDIPKQAIHSCIMTLLDAIEITYKQANAYPHQLSGGQKQKIAWAIALANQPDYLILDEPTSALDFKTKKSLVTLLQTHVDQHHTGVLIASHDTQLLAESSQTMVILNKGQIIETGKTNLVFTQPSHAATQKLVRTPRYQLESKPCFDSHTLTIRGLIPYQNNHSHWLTRLLFSKHKPQSPLSLTLHQNECLGIIGKNGCGKTSLLMAIAQLIPHAGDVSLLGEKLNLLSKKAMTKRRKQLQIVFQDPHGSFLPHQSMADQLIMTMNIHHPDQSFDQHWQIICDLCHRFDLDPLLLEHTCHECSQGEVQRLGIIKALCIQPQCLLLDEVTANLDPCLSHKLMQYLLDYQSNHGLSLLMVSHDHQLLQQYCHRVIDLDRLQTVVVGY